MAQTLLLQVQNLNKSFGERHIFKDANVSFGEKQKIGVIGPNGAGKTTFFKILMKKEVPDSGEILWMPDLRLGYIEQHDAFEEGETVIEFLQRYTAKPDWECAKVASQFQLKGEKLTTKITALSGGWQMRVKLTATLLFEPNLLLLDEPTNYLDLTTLMLLENFLTSFNGTVLVITHDREFIKKTCTSTLDVEHGQLFLHHEPLEKYLEFKKEREELAANVNVNIERKQKQLQVFVDRFGAKASMAKSAQSKLKQISKLDEEKLETITKSATVRMYIPLIEEKNGIALECQELTIGYNGENERNVKIAKSDEKIWNQENIKIIRKKIVIGEYERDYDIETKKEFESFRSLFYNNSISKITQMLENCLKDSGTALGVSGVTFYNNLDESDKKNTKNDYISNDWVKIYDSISSFYMPKVDFLELLTKIVSIIEPNYITHQVKTGKIKDSQQLTQNETVSKTKIIASNINLEVDRGLKVAILGDNGQGKSTLLKTLAGEIPALDGFCEFKKGLKIAHYHQHVAANLDPNETVFNFIKKGGQKEEIIYRVLSNFLFKKADYLKQIKVLSGGEKARLCLAGMFLSKADVYLLDEPTNHLDFETVEAMGKALGEFNGTVFVISHNRTFVKLIASQVWEVGDGKVKRILGSYDDYLWSKEQEISQSLGLKTQKKTGNTKAENSEQEESEKFENMAKSLDKSLDKNTVNFLSDKEKAKKLYETRKEFGKLEKKMKNIENKVQIGEETQKNQVILEDLEIQWLEMQNQIEELS